MRIETRQSSHQMLTFTKLSTDTRVILPSPSTATDEPRKHNKINEVVKTAITVCISSCAALTRTPLTQKANAFQRKV